MQNHQLQHHEDEMLEHKHYVEARMQLTHLSLAYFCWKYSNSTDPDHTLKT